MDKGQGYKLVGFKEYAIVKRNKTPNTDLSWSEQWYKEDEDSIKDFVLDVEEATRMDLNNALSVFFRLSRRNSKHELKVVRFDIKISDVEVKVDDPD